MPRPGFSIHPGEQGRPNRGGHRVSNRNRTSGGGRHLSDEVVPQARAAQPGAPATAPAQPQSQDRVAHPRRLRTPLLLAAPVVVVIAALFIYLHGGRYEDTDDAYVQSVKVQVSANVAGRVVAVGVTNNQRVRTGNCCSASIRRPIRRRSTKRRRSSPPPG